MKFAHNKAVKLAYEEQGFGTPVLLIMGYAARAAHWGEKFRNLLASGYRVIAFDNRGTGDSDKPTAAWTMRDMVDDTVAVMDAAGVTAAHVVGLSMGGAIAQELALAYPERLLTLTLIATTSGGPDMLPAKPEAINALLNPEQGQPVEKVLEKTWCIICGPGFLDVPGRLEACLKLDLEKRTPVAMLLNQQKAIQTSDRHLRLASIKTPTLVVVGKNDPLVPLANAERLCALIPGSRLVHLENCGHMVGLEKPLELARAIMGFIAEHT